MKTNQSQTPLKEKDYAQTPAWFITSMEDTIKLKFDMDVCANGATAKCERYYSLEERGEDSLTLDWGRINWCNPPFSGKNILAFIDKAVEEAEKGNCTAMIMPANIETKYVRTASEHADTLYKMPFRLEYLRPDGTRFLSKQGKPQTPEFASLVVWFTPWGLSLPLREVYKDFRIGFKP